MKYAALLICAPLAACSAPTVLSTPNSCATLVPQSWHEGVAAPELPADDQVGTWIAFGDAAVGKLDQANSRTRDTLDIVTACEARDAQAVRKASRGFFGRLFNYSARPSLGDRAARAIRNAAQMSSLWQLSQAAPSMAKISRNAPSRPAILAVRASNASAASPRSSAARWNSAWTRLGTAN